MGLANILFTQELAKRLKGTGITTYCLHPGVIGTDLNRHIKDSLGSVMAAAMYLLYPFSKTIKSGAQTSIFVQLMKVLQTSLDYTMQIVRLLKLIRTPREKEIQKDCGN